MRLEDKLLTTEQRTALLAYAKENGRLWKSELIWTWERASARVAGDVSPELQQLRNTHGPSWLKRVSLRKLQEIGT
jgi:hypothetical protein